MIKPSMIVLLAGVGFAPGLGAQQSVGAPNTGPAPSRADVTRAREATAMKCLTGQAIAAQTLNAAGEARIPQRTTRGGLGLGSMDASEGMSRPPLNPQLHEVPGFDRTQRGTRSFSGAMDARNGVAAHCTPVPAKATGDSSVAGKSPGKPDSRRITP